MLGLDCRWTQVPLLVTRKTSRDVEKNLVKLSQKFSVIKILKNIWKNLGHLGHLSRFAVFFFFF